MKTADTQSITVETLVNAPVEKAWKYFSEPEHITKWAFASDDWHAPYADNDLRKDGKFKTTMAAKDGSFSFDFEGVYTNVVPKKTFEYAMADGRKVKVDFAADGSKTRVTETFDPESQNPIDMQRAGWQAILENYRRHVESN
ncbi:SRPBCC family protein [Chryseolinea sp. T2]|uniref:SRPBCC family protein n=1 Tax=Chryseolinea sp. T2 TaxID=3129255 RepID=UPI0030786A10